MSFVRLMLAASLACFVALAGWMYSREALFRLSDIQVETQDVDLVDQIQKKWIHLLGRPLFSISLEKLEGELKNQFRLEHIVIKRKWPSTLSIQLTEKDPVAIEFRSGRYWILDKDCEIISALQRPKGLPVLKIHGAGSRDVRLAADSICSKIPEFRSYEGAHLSWDDIDEINFYIDRGWVLRAFEKDLELVLGHRNLLSAWQRATLAMDVLIAKNLKPKFLESSYSKRVVFRLDSVLGQKLQNLKDELNYKELVQRAPKKSQWAPAVR
jgi:cell division septal protein FtsQ